MRLEKMIGGWTRKKRGDFTAIKTLPGSSGEFCELPPDMDARVVTALKSRAIERLYSHQGEAWRLARDGRDFVVVTPTASGKTLCYNLPVCQAVVDDPATTALYLFPTKALSQDQMQELQLFSAQAGIGLKAFTYDGDTPADLRRKIRGEAHVVISNPDMLHTAILPHHTGWERFLHNLKFLVIDEIHACRGVFGSHVANVLRRLHRVCAFYGARPQILCSSATIGNPLELASLLTQRKMELIERNGAPRAGKIFLFYNPPLVNANLGVRAGCIHTVRRFVEDCVRQKATAIVFAGSRQNVEVLVRYLRNSFAEAPWGPARIRGYRGGYLPKMRRRIEEELRAGEVNAIISTNALELGVDIGSLDACILAGYPGTVASTWQQAGRAGRRRGEALALMVARNLPLDQFVVNNPDYFFGRSPEMGLIHPDNLRILLQHVQCAAFELPFRKGEAFGKEDLEEILRYLEENHFVHYSGDAWYWSQESYPADAVSLRNLSSENFVVTDRDQNNKVIAEVDYESAPYLIHPDAIYMHQGEQYFVEHLDWDGRRASVTPVKVDYYTQAISYSRIQVLDVFHSRVEPGCRIEQGEIAVVTHYPGFKKIKFYTTENIGYGKLHLPHQQMHTTGCWFALDAGLADRLSLSTSDLVEAALGLSCALHTIACLTLMCDYADIGRSVGDRGLGWFAEESRDGAGFFEGGKPGVGAVLPQPFQPTLFVWDNYSGGMGCSERLFELYPEVLGRTRALLGNCRCVRGCPSCIGPVAERAPQCKSHVLRLVEEMLRGISPQAGPALSGDDSSSADWGMRNAE